jgi:hypothetical protein
MSGYYIVVNKDNKSVPVHNLKTGIYLVKMNGGKVVDNWSKRVVFQK